MVIVNYENIEGNKLCDRVLLFHKFEYPDEWYTTEEKSFGGYVFSHMKEGSAPTNAPFGPGEIKYVTYVYDLPRGSLIERHEDENGHLLKDEKTTVELSDTPYTTSSLALKGYVYIGIKEGSDEVNGIYETGITKTVTYIYKKVVESTEQAPPTGDAASIASLISVFLLSIGSLLWIIYKGNSVES